MPHKFSIETNLKQKCKEKDLHTKNQHTQNILRKKLHIKLYIQKYGRKKVILFQKKFSCIIHKGIEP